MAFVWGTPTDPAITTDAPGTISGKLRGMVALLSSFIAPSGSSSTSTTTVTTTSISVADATLTDKVDRLNQTMTETNELLLQILLTVTQTNTLGPLSR